MTHPKDVVTWAGIMENLDQIPKGDPFARGRRPADPLRERAMAEALSASHLADRVRELEAERDHERALLECAPWATYSEGETLLRAQAAEAQQLAKQMMDERDGYARSHAILRAIHGALTDALPSTPIPALDSFAVVEMVRGLATEAAALRREIAELMDDH